MAFHQRRLSLVARLALGFALLLAALGLASPQPVLVQAAPPAAPRSGGAFTVNSAADTSGPDASLTLRKALLVAKGGTTSAGLNRAATAGEQALLGGCVFDGGGHITGGCGTGIADTIHFSASLGAHPIITLTAALPDISDSAPTIVDGSANGVFPIIAAGGLPGGANALQVSSNGNTLQGLTITGAPQDDLSLSGSQNQVLANTLLLKAGRYGLHVPGGSSNTIASALVGSASAVVGTCSQGNGQGGIVLDAGAASNIITATTVACSGGVGVRFDGASGNNLEWSTVITSTENGVEMVDGAAGDYVTASTLTGSGQYGALISGAATQGNYLTGANPYGGLFGLIYTFITHNTRGGVRLEAGAHNNVLSGLLIGTYSYGGAANGGPGLTIDGAPNNVIFSQDQDEAHISGNLGPGVIVSNTVGNAIGNGLAHFDDNAGPGLLLMNTSSPSIVQGWVVSNTGPGVEVLNSSGTAIKDTLANSNAGPGVELINSGGSTVQPGNVARNVGPGIVLSDTANTFVSPNLVWQNTGAGIAVEGNSSTGDLIVPVADYGNGGLPIDLGNDGHTANGAHSPPGPNDWLPYPIIQANIPGDSSIITGTACANCAVLIYAASGNPTTPGGGGSYLQGTAADGTGNWHTTLTGGYTVGGVAVQACVAPCAFGSGITPTHSDTSEIGPAIAGWFIVSSAGDDTNSDGSLTLREALLVAKGGTGPAGLGRATSAGEQALLGGCVFDGGGHITGGCGPAVNDTIVFSAGLGIHPVITLTAALPAITDTASTRVDGTVNGVLPIIQASGVPSDALLLASNNNTLTGLTITGAPRDDLELTGKLNNVFTGTVLLRAGRYGLHLAGAFSSTVQAVQVGECGAGNGQGGVVIDSGAAANIIIGATVACNNGVGVRVDGSGAFYDHVYSSTITGQTGNGIEIVNGAHQNNVEDDTIISNSLDGLLISGGANNVIFTNDIGVTPAGAAAGNGRYGLHLAAGTYGSWGGSIFYRPNVISGNGLGGVRVDTGAYGNNIGGSIGLSPTGGALVPNAGPGVTFDSALSNTLGDYYYGGVTLVEGNLGPGVLVTNSSGNFIELLAMGVMSNTGPGLLIVNSRDTTAIPLKVSGNGGAGIAVEGAASTGNLLRPFADLGNAGLAIDLGNDGHTANGAHSPPGPNDWLPYPDITAVSGGVVTGTACANCTVNIYLASGNPIAPGGGGGFNQVAQADGAGHWHATLVAGLTPSTITLQACQGTCPVSLTSPVPADTSELSPLLYQMWLPTMRR
jgi:hypothetical protein